jgi:hypothetical protein
MKRYFLIVSALIISVLIMGCVARETTTKGDAYPKMYQQKPLTVLVLPPLNESTAADAKEYYMVTVAQPISMYGYYIMPTEVTTPMLRAEGVIDTELLANAPLNKFKDLMGADAVLFIKIKKWDTSYYVIGGHMTVSLDLLMKSTVTNEIIWQYDGTFTVDTTVRGGSGWAGLIVQVVGTAIKTAATDYVPIAARANGMALSSLPYGKYHPLFLQDMKNEVVLKGGVGKNQ